eukprot:5023195-Prymnesium_polylepis.1
MGRFRSATRKRRDPRTPSPETSESFSRQLHYSGSHPQATLLNPHPRAPWRSWQLFHRLHRSHHTARH